MLKRPAIYLLFAVALAMMVWLGLGHIRRAKAGGFATRFTDALNSRASAELRRLVYSPPFLNDKSAVERDLLILDLLATEVSAEGMAILIRDGDFGSVLKLFPAEALGWCQAFGVKAADCDAFRLQRGEFTAELVLHRQSDASYRVLRCNDIRQLANPASSP